MEIDNSLVDDFILMDENGIPSKLFESTMNQILTKSNLIIKNEH